MKGNRFANLAVLLLLVVTVVLSFRFLDMNLAELFSAEGLRQMGDYASGFSNPDFSPQHLSAIGRGALETLAMSAIGTLLAALLGLLMALAASGRHGWLARVSSRFVLNGLRSVPELVWAALMVLAAGLGPNAGTLALALHTTGVLGRLYAEALENTPTANSDSLRLAGSSRSLAFCYGTLPNIWPQLVAYGLYRWENNIRMASILGFVGAGGLGQMLYVNLSLFQEARAATMILAMLALVLGVDALSSRVRQRWVTA